MQRFVSVAPLLSLSLIALAGMLLAGCTTSRPSATARYKQTQNETVYRARRISLGTMFPTGGMSRDPEVSMSSWATCDGENCRPQHAWISFNIRGVAGRTNVLSNRDVQMRTAENLHEWPESRDRIQSELKAAGAGSELTRIRMSMSTLRDIAQSKGQVRGQIGEEEFSLSYSARTPLRALLKKIDSAASQQAPAS